MKKNFKIADLEKGTLYNVRFLDHNGTYENRILTGEKLAATVNGLAHCYKEIHAEEYTAADENRDHCKHIALEAEAYTDGAVHRCPECDNEIRFPDNVGDKYRCPHCHAVNDVDDYEQLSIWDYMSDILDIEYRCGSDKEYRSCKIMVACGGPNIYIDTASAMVKLYWWTEYAEYPLSYAARDAIDE